MRPSQGRHAGSSPAGGTRRDTQRAARLRSRLPWGRDVRRGIPRPTQRIVVTGRACQPAYPVRCSPYRPDTAAPPPGRERRRSRGPMARRKSRPGVTWRLDHARHGQRAPPARAGPRRRVHVAETRNHGGVEQFGCARRVHTPGGRRFKSGPRYKESAPVQVGQVTREPFDSASGEVAATEQTAVWSRARFASHHARAGGERSRERHLRSWSNGYDGGLRNRRRRFDSSERTELLAPFDSGRTSAGGTGFTGRLPVRLGPGVATPSRAGGTASDLPDWRNGRRAGFRCQ